MSIQNSRTRALLVPELTVAPSAVLGSPVCFQQFVPVAIILQTSNIKLATACPIERLAIVGWKTVDYDFFATGVHSSGHVRLVWHVFLHLVATG